MTRYVNPYSGLSDGLRDASRAWLQSTVSQSDHELRMAQLAVDQKQRQEDYALRLRQMKMAETEHNATMADNKAKGMRDTLGRFRSSFAALSKADGTMDYSDLSKVERAVNDGNFLLETDPYAKETIVKALGPRIFSDFGPDAKIRLVAHKGGIAAEVYDSKDAAKTGVLTENASKDPNDPVADVAPIIPRIIDITEQAKQLGLSPDESAYFLSKSLPGISGNNPAGVDPETRSKIDNILMDNGMMLPDTPEQNNSGQGGIPQEQINGVYDQPAPMADAASRLKQTPDNRNWISKLNDNGPSFPEPVDRSGFTSPAQHLGAEVRDHLNVKDFVTGTASNIGKNFVQAVKDEAGLFMQGLNGGQQQQTGGTQDSTTPQNGPTETPKSLADYDPFNTRRLTTPTDTSPQGMQGYFTKTQKDAIAVSVAESRAIRNSLINKANSEKQHVERLGRFLAMKMQDPDSGLDASSAAQIFETGRMRADQFYKLALAQPTDAKILAQWASKGGARGVRTPEDKKVALEMIEKTNTALKDIMSSVQYNDGTDNKKLPEFASGGVLDYLAGNGVFNAEDQYRFVTANRHIIAEAAYNLGKNWPHIVNTDNRDLRSYMAFSMHQLSRAQGMNAPPTLTDDDDIKIYNDNLMKMYKEFEGDPAQLIRVTAAASKYEKDVKDKGVVNLPIDEYVKYAKELN